MAEEEPRHMVGGLRDDDLEGRDWARVLPRRISESDWIRFEGYMYEILQALGMQLDTPGTVKTPMRYLRALFDSTEGYEGDPKLVTAFPTECDGGPDCDLSQVIEGPFRFTRCASTTPFRSSATPTWATSPTSTSSASPSSRALCVSSRGGSRSRSGWGERSPRRFPASSRLTASPSTSRRSTSAHRCAVSANRNRQPERPSGVGTTSQTPSFARSS